MVDGKDTLKALQARIKRKGDLPIFSASVNQIRKVSTSPDASAMALSREAEKDTNLAAKLLRLANSPYYNRGRGKISVISRAIIILGFSTVKNLCLTLKLVDSFQHEHPSIEMNKMMVNAYLSAGFVREIALKCGVKDVEETYTCALMHNLGEILIAYFLPEKFTEMKELEKTQKKPWKDVEQEVLGISMKDIGQQLATNWEYPSTIVSTMEHYDPDDTTPVREGVHLNRALASLATNVVGTLYQKDKNSQNNKTFPELLEKIADTVGLDSSVIEDNLVGSFKMSCDLADEYGLDKEDLMPVMDISDDESRDRMASRLSYLASTSKPEQNDDEIIDTESSSGVGDATETTNQAAVTPTKENVKSATQKSDHEKIVSPALNQTTENPENTLGQTNLSVQLETIQEITALISTSSDLNTIFAKVLQGIHQGAGFDRAMLCLLTPDHKQYIARLVYGDDTDVLKQYFNRPVDVKNDLFSTLIIDGSELLIADFDDKEWEGMISKNFQTTTNSWCCIMASLRNGTRPIGMFYADITRVNSGITTQQHRSFIQFITQARLALQMSSEK